MSTPLEQINSALESLVVLEGYAQSGASAEALPIVGQSAETIRTVLETIQAPLVAQESTPRPLTAYKQGQYVETLHIPSGTWIDGYISSIDAVSRHLHIETERGPLTVGVARRVRPQSAEKVK